MSSTINQQKLLVEGLRIEAQAQRVQMSVTLKDLVDFVQKHTPQDPLIVGIDKKSNHFIEKSSCELL